MEEKEEMKKYVRVLAWFVTVLNASLGIFYSSIVNLILAIFVLFCLLMTRKPNKLESENE